MLSRLSFEPESPAMPTAAPEPSGLAPILVAEDDDDARHAFPRFFRKMCLANPVVLARDGNEALEYLEVAKRGDASAPVFILLDLHMPGKTGLDVLRWVRTSASLRDTPIVILTGSAELADGRALPAVVDLRDSHLIAVEALVRWQRPDGELVMPAQFIDVA